MQVGALCMQLKWAYLEKTNNALKQQLETPDEAQGKSSILGFEDDRTQITGTMVP